MGRRRKQPRRIVTFNLNDELADEIDNLRLPNRSEWANKVFKDYLTERKDAADAKKMFQDALTDFERQVEEDTRLRDDPRRLVALLFNYLNEGNMPDYRPVGRYPVAQLLLRMLQDPDGPTPPATE